MLWLLGCSSAPDVEVLAARDLGPFETTDAVKARDGGSRVSFGDRTFWLGGLDGRGEVVEVEVR